MTTQLVEKVRKSNQARSNSPVNVSESERRELHFDTLEDMLAEATKLAAGDVYTTGNHSFGQILEHLARSFEMCSGKLTPPKLPFMFRLMSPLIRLSVLNKKPLQPGINLEPEAEFIFWPSNDTDVQQALSHLKDAVAEYKKRVLSQHPIFGKLTREQNDLLNRKHAALHLSFVHPV